MRFEQVNIIQSYRMYFIYTDFVYVTLSILLHCNSNTVIHNLTKNRIFLCDRYMWLVWYYKMYYSSQWRLSWKKKMCSMLATLVRPWIFENEKSLSGWFEKNGVSAKRIVPKITSQRNYTIAVSPRAILQKRARISVVHRIAATRLVIKISIKFI